jgi:hypothetical protein
MTKAEIFQAGRDFEKSAIVALLEEMYWAICRRIEREDLRLEYADHVRDGIVQSQEAIDALVHRRNLQEIVQYMKNYAKTQRDVEHESHIRAIESADSEEERADFERLFGNRGHCEASERLEAERRKLLWNFQVKHGLRPSISGRK